MIDTSTNTSFVEANVQSRFILTNLHDGDLPEAFYRDVSDFPHGTTLNIPTVGARTIQDVSENEEMVPTAINSGNVTMTITEEEGDAYYVTDNMREDSFDINGLLSQNAMEQTKAIQASRETKFLAAINAAQTASGRNLHNNFEHRWVAGATNNVIALDDFRKMKVSFQKANAPQAGRIALVDSVAAATLEQNFLTTGAIDFNPRFEGILTEGFDRDHRFVRHILGWDIWETEKLPSITDETIAGSIFGQATQFNPTAGGVANIFMCVADDNTKPMMHAWRRMPKVETKRNTDLRRDEFYTSSRYGYGNQRVDTVGVVITHATNIE